MQSALPSRWTARSGLLLATTLAAGCASAPPSSPPVAPTQAVESVAPPPAYLPVVRYGRYTLVELAPTAAQQDLLLQVVDVAVPDTLHASVGDALRHVLQRSGYRLCDGHHADALLTFPLPAAHYRLGPVVLRDALLTLAGPAWDLQVDHGTRRVCVTQAKPDVPEPPHHSEKLLPRGERTMLDIWQHETGGGPGSQAGRQLLDARQSLRRPLTEADARATTALNTAYTRSAANEIHRQFHRLPNPDLVMYVFPHLAGTDPVPVPGYSTVFPLYQRVQYAMPGERVEDY